MPEKLIHISFPDSINFADLKLSRDQQTGDVVFDWLPIELIC